MGADGRGQAHAAGTANQHVDFVVPFDVIDIGWGGAGVGAGGLSHGLCRHHHGGSADACCGTGLEELAPAFRLFVEVFGSIARYVVFLAHNRILLLRLPLLPWQRRLVQNVLPGPPRPGSWSRK
jgi:hypothetical protein